MSKKRQANPKSANKINLMVAIDHGGYDGKIAGIGRNLSYILPHINKKRFNIILVILGDKGSLEARFADTGIKVLHFRRKKFDPLILVDFIKIIKKENIHLLHLYQYTSSNFGRLAGKITGVPLILNLNDLNYNYPWYQWFADRLLMWANGSVIAVSEAVKKSGAEVRAIDPSKISVIYNAVSTGQLNLLDPGACRELKKHWEIKKECKIVGTITRLHEVKGNDVLLRAAKIVLQSLPNTCFVFVGDGPLKGKLLNLSKKLKINNNVIFTGYQENVAGFLSIFDVMVIASNTEGFSLALLEAMNMSKAIVATNKGGPKEILRQEISGLLVPPQNPEALAEKIVYLLKNDQQRKILGENTKSESKRFTIDSHISAREKLYEKVIATKF